MKKNVNFGVIILLLIFAFFSALILTIASRQNTEVRSKAAGGPYDPPIYSVSPSPTPYAMYGSECVNPNHTYPENPMSCGNCPNVYRGDRYYRKDGKYYCADQPPTPTPARWDQKDGYWCIGDNCDDCPGTIVRNYGSVKYCKTR